MKTIRFKNGDTLPLGKIICIGRNYLDHAKELDSDVPKEPLFFYKPNFTVIHSYENVIYPSFTKNLHYEVELVVAVGETVRNISVDEAKNVILGYTVGLDMTARDVQQNAIKNGLPWTLAKGFDTACVLSDFIYAKDYNLTLNEDIMLYVNNQQKQFAKLNTMIFKPDFLISYISKLITIEKGDIIMTGTPAGVGPVVPGDVIFAKIENIAELHTQIVKGNE
jgi:5-carboxymethyl-2-hydroxymuconate isomerase